MTMRETKPMPTFDQATPATLVNVVTTLQETPVDEQGWTLMDETQRSELLKELSTWSRDPDGLDWDYVDSKD